MSSQLTNKAAYVVTEPSRHIEVRDAPYPSPAPGQVIIRNHAVAINPIDWLLPMFGGFQHLKWPFVLGSDSAGEVVKVGTNVTRFHVGDRVVGQAIGYDDKVNSSAESSFQLFTVLREDMASRIPDRVSYEQACVLPLGLGTAACGLFQKDLMALNLPKPASASKAIADSRKTVVVIWGGSTSVGSNAIQLASAAGYEVATTCSARNFDYCKSLGATHCFDYNSPTIRADMVRALKDKPLAGAVTIGDASEVDACFEIFDHCATPKGLKHKSIAIIAYPKPPGEPKRFVTAQIMFHFIRFMLSTTVKGWMKGVRWGMVNGTTLAWNGVGKSVYADFLQHALEEGTFQCKPEPLVVGHGLEKIDEACEVQKKGVSARKVVVTL
jgi:NADPH:quinone reductase-like Zn-dependent oxidoreductase